VRDRGPPGNGIPGSRGVGLCQSSGVEIRAQPGWRSEEFSERSGGQGWPQQASARRPGLTPSLCDVNPTQRPAVPAVQVPAVIWSCKRFGRVGGEDACGLPGAGMAQRPAVPPGSRRGASMEKGTGSERSEVPVPFSNSRMHAEYGFARGEPVPWSRRCWRVKAGMPRASQHRASGRQDACSERPSETARAHPEPV